MRWSESPFVLAASGTLAIHVLLAVAADAIVVTHPLHPDPPPPKVELFEIKYDPPPPPAKHEDPPVPAKELPPTKTVVPRAAIQKIADQPPPTKQLAVLDPLPASEAPTIAMDDIAPAATGIDVARGPRTTGAVGKGGTGTGTGSGSGGGAGAPPPMSVATIKTRAMPRGDFSYYDLGKDYPAEAKQLGIEGDIRVRLVVDDKGKVASRVLLNRLGHGLDELAMERARQIEFTPARDSDDRPVSSVVVWTFHMTLPK